jgi:hypothetical protein
MGMQNSERLTTDDATIHQSGYDEAKKGGRKKKPALSIEQRRLGDGSAA